MAERQSPRLPKLIAPEAGEIQAFNHLDKSATYAIDEALADADPGSYDALVLPGGVANPDQLRTNERAVQFIQAIFSAGKPVGIICHGPWTLVEADLVPDRKLTSWPAPLARARLRLHALLRRLLYARGVRRP